MRCDAVKPSLHITKNQRRRKPAHVSKHSSLLKKPRLAFAMAAEIAGKGVK
jgi:hypothetical protein